VLFLFGIGILINIIAPGLDLFEIALYNNQLPTVYCWYCILFEYSLKNVFGV